MYIIISYKQTDTVGKLKYSLQSLYDKCLQKIKIKIDNVNISGGSKRKMEKKLCRWGVINV